MDSCAAIGCENPALTGKFFCNDCMREFYFEHADYHQCPGHPRLENIADAEEGDYILSNARDELLKRTVFLYQRIKENRRRDWFAAHSYRVKFLEELVQVLTSDKKSDWAALSLVMCRKLQQEDHDCKYEQSSLYKKRLRPFKYVKYNIKK